VPLVVSFNISSLSQAKEDVEAGRGQEGLIDPLLISPLARGRSLLLNPF
jgi:hypothetical protein